MKQAIVVAFAALPACVLVAQFVVEGPGANPIEDVTHVTGEWGLRLVLFSLAITPLRKIFGVKGIAPLRRTLGLAGFAYACVHLFTWSVVDLGLDRAAIFEDLTERPYVMAGMAAFMLLLVLASTSTRASIRRLGHYWVELHRIVYAAAILAIVHHFWLIKADDRPAILHALALALLLGARLFWWIRQRRESA